MGETVAKIRAFLAVNLSVPVTRAIAELQGALRQGIPRELRVAWVPPANLHLTIKFLGPTEPEAAAAIADTLATALEKTPPCEVRARGAGAFPDPRRPRVLWVGLEDPSGGLAGVHRVVEDRMADLGFAREERPFSPHLTLGRVKDGHADVTALLATTAERQLGTSIVREIVLYESRLRAQGAEYVALRRVPFGGRSPERPAEAPPLRVPAPPSGEISADGARPDASQGRASSSIDASQGRASSIDAPGPGPADPDPETEKTDHGS